MNQITIRRAIKEGKLSYVVVRGRYQLNFESVLKWSQESSRTKNKLESAGIGQYVNQWRIKNPLFSPNPKLINPSKVTGDTLRGPRSSDSSEAMPSERGAMGQDPSR